MCVHACMRLRISGWLVSAVRTLCPFAACFSSKRLLLLVMSISHLDWLIVRKCFTTTALGTRPLWLGGALMSPFKWSHQSLQHSYSYTHSGCKLSVSACTLSQAFMKVCEDFSVLTATYVQVYNTASSWVDPAALSQVYSQISRRRIQPRYCQAHCWPLLSLLVILSQLGAQIRVIVWRPQKLPRLFGCQAVAKVAATWAIGATVSRRGAGRPVIITSP